MVELVPLSMDHLDHVMGWVNDLEVMQYFANRQTLITREEEARYIESLLASKNDSVFSIFENTEIDNYIGEPYTDRKYVGQCSINQIYWPARNGRLFVVIKSGAHGHGYGQKAVQLLLQHAWTRLDLHKVWLIARQDNRRAQAMYLTLGFNFEGLLRDEYLVGNRFFDMVRMGILNPVKDPR